MKKISVIIISLSLLLMPAISLTAQNAGGAAPGDAEVQERLNYIQTVFDDGQTPAAIWSYTWTGLYAGLTGFFLYSAIANEEGRVGNIVSTVKTTLSCTLLIVSPFYPRSAGSDLSEIEADTPEERAAKLSRAEEMLQRNHDKAKSGTSLFKHMMTLGVNLIGGVVVYGFEGWGGWDKGLKPAVISFAGGMILGELCILTQPTRAIDDYNDYNSKYRPAYGASADIENNFYWAVYPGGFVAGTRF